MKKILFFLLFLPQLLLSQGDLVATNWVNDFTGTTLTESQVNSLNSQISKFEEKTDIEISVAIVKTLNDRDIESFSNELFKKWGVGKAGRNNGLLVVIAPNERKWRVEVGYGLEPYYTDYQSYEFAESNFKPNFRAGDFFTGIKGFITETSKHLGSATWEDRVAYQKAQEEADKEAMANFWWNFLYVVLTILAIILIIVAFVKFKKDLDAKRKFDVDKAGKADSYKEKVMIINNKLKLYKVKGISIDSNRVNKILNSKTQSELQSNYMEATQSLKYHSNLIDSLGELDSNIGEMNRTWRELNNLEKNNTLTETKSNKIEVDADDSYNTIKEKITFAKKSTSIYSERISKIKEFNSLLNVGVITDESIDNTINKLSNKFIGRQYTTDSSTMNGYSNKLKQAASQFNRVEKSFDNFDNIKNSYSTYNFIKNELLSYVDKVGMANDKYDSMLMTLRGSKSTIDSLESKLKKHMNSRDVSNRTKAEIGAFIAGLLAFKVGSDILQSFNLFTSLSDKANSLLSKAKSEIDAEERKRRRKREEEEEEERRRRRNSSSGSSYGGWSSGSSWGSSSDSGSSWGGFGGGDSGGGGSSGDW